MTKIYYVYVDEIPVVSQCTDNSWYSC